MRYPKIFVIILNYNGKKDTLECIASLKKSSFLDFQLLIIDNGSTDGSVESLRKYDPKIPILEMKQNLGFAGGNNEGISWALSKGAEWIFLLNNDTIVDPDCLKKFIEATQKKPEVKIFGAKIYSHQNPWIIDHLGGYFDLEKAECFSYAKNEKEDHVSFETMQAVDYVCGASIWIHKKVFQEIGLLESDFFLFWEETDFCFRAKRKGFEVWTAPQAKVFHKISSSFTGGKTHTHYFWWRSRLLWLSRNLSFDQRKKIYRKVIFPELYKALRHYLLKNLEFFFTRKEKAKKKANHAKAALLGAFHYLIQRFGNCPQKIIDGK